MSDSAKNTLQIPSTVFTVKESHTVGNSALPEQLAHIFELGHRVQLATKVDSKLQTDQIIVRASQTSDDSDYISIMPIMEVDLTLPNSTYENGKMTDAQFHIIYLGEENGHVSLELIVWDKQQEVAFRATLQSE